VEKGGEMKEKKEELKFIFLQYRGQKGLSSLYVRSMHEPTFDNPYKRASTYWYSCG